MRKIKKAVGGGFGGGLGPIVAAAIAAQWPQVTPEMSLLIGVAAAGVLGFAGAYIPKYER